MPAVCAIIHLIISQWKGGRRPCAGAEGTRRAGMELMGSKVVLFFLSTAYRSTQTCQSNKQVA